VADCAGFDSFSLVAVQLATPAAITFASRHPDNVARLALVDGFLRWRDFLGQPQVRAIQAAAALDFTTATEVIGFAAFGSIEEARQHGEYIRACASAEVFAAYDTYGTWDASAEAQQISAPTVVLRHAGLEYVTLDMARDLAARVPGAHLAVVDGKWMGAEDEVVDRIDAFVNDVPRTPDIREGGAASGVRTVLFTDLVGHTEMMRRLGDARGRELLREHERITRDAIKRYGGVEVKTDGDSFMVSFGSVASAMECAIALQRAFEARNESAGQSLRVRMGLNVGEPIEDKGDLFGETVILASRIKDQAGGGEILIADPVRHLLAGKGFVFAERGEFVPKGFEDAVRLFGVRWQEDA
jgi:class 3 adenylate cyclase